MTVIYTKFSHPAPVKYVSVVLTEPINSSYECEVVTIIDGNDVHFVYQGVELAQGDLPIRVECSGNILENPLEYISKTYQVNDHLYLDVCGWLKNGKVQFMTGDEMKWMPAGSVGPLGNDSIRGNLTLAILDFFYKWRNAEEINYRLNLRLKPSAPNAFPTITKPMFSKSYVFGQKYYGEGGHTLEDALSCFWGYLKMQKQ